MYKILNGREFDYMVNERGCHVPHKAPTNKAGYVKAQFKGVSYFLHRLAYEQYYGIKADGVVMHNCDNPSCFNPLHLSLGTQADNMKDMALKGRSKGINKGETNGNAVINEATAKAIYVANGTLNAIAEQFGVTRKTVENIKYGYTWRWATQDLVKPTAKRTGRPRK